MFEARNKTEIDQFKAQMSGAGKAYIAQYEDYSLFPAAAALDGTVTPTPNPDP